MYDYLSRFPIIDYNGNVVNNILTKISLNKLALDSTTVFYPYVIKEGERPDTIAAEYYDDPRYSWVVCMCNNIVDPYYDWPLSSEEFKRHVIAKYGSVEEAQQRIAYWRNNWYLDDSSISTSYFNSLTSRLKSYWTPEFGTSATPISYKRKQSDLYLETNVNSKVVVTSTDGFVVGENIQQYSGGSLVGKATINVVLDSTTLIVHNVIGTLSAGTVIGHKSGTSTTLSTYTVLNYSIPIAEVPYWTYVDSYDYEEEVNESKKHIKLIDKIYIDRIEREMENIL